MARWRKKVLEEMTARIQQLGLTNCPVCESGTMSVLRYPVVLPIGGLSAEAGDPERNILFMVQIVCSVCGHAMLFDSEHFGGGDDKALVVGMSDEEEAAWEAQQG